MMAPAFEDKQAARQWVWDTLEDEGIARFPFPPHDRIPNVEGAEQAAKRLLDHPVLAKARRVKVNPDAPQLPLRRLLLERGVTVFVPTPRLRSGFNRLSPSGIPTEHRSEAATLSRMEDWAEPVPLDQLPPMDAIVAGSVAVTRSGRRCGKGEGYSDLEYAILRELGHPDVPVATTVHPIQIVHALPHDPTDVPLHAIATPDEVLDVEDPPPPPEGIDWSLLSEERIEEMPVLAALREMGG